jgi:transcriptional regulator with XRE-family HTH domain
MRTHLEIMTETAAHARARRLALNLTQTGLEERSGVSLGSLKRFERTGKISFESLLKIALALNALNDFEALFTSRTTSSQLRLDEILKQPKTRQRGRVK